MFNTKKEKIQETGRGRERGIESQKGREEGVRKTIK